MKKIINFSGLAFELGQSKKGLIASSKLARGYFSILRNADIELVDNGDIVQDEHNVPLKFFSEKDLDELSWIQYQKAFHKTLSLLKENIPLINWGGDHSVAIATVAAFVKAFDEGYVLWIDAHADLNLPSHSLSGNLHGMPLALLLNLDNLGRKKLSWFDSALDPKKLIYLGLRDLDPFELDVITALGIKAFFYSDIQERGIANVMSEISSYVKENPLHVSFDIDSVNPIVAPSTGVPVKSGFSLEELSFLGREIFKNFNTRSIDVVEINPNIGTKLQIDQTFITAFNFLKTIFTHTKRGEQNDGMGTGVQTKCTDEMEWYS